jgi:putative ABC transport system permease protein
MVSSPLLRRKLLRDTVRMRAQVAAIALVVASAVATFLTMRGAYDSLVSAKLSYYSRYRFPDVFAQLVRAPEQLRKRIAEIPGVAVVYTRVVSEATLDVPGLPEPATGRIVSLPERGRPALNDLYVRSGRWPVARSRDEVLVSESFATENFLRAGSTIEATIHGRHQKLRIVGVAISPEYVNEIATGAAFPDHRRFGVLWMGRDALSAAVGMLDAFNEVQLTLARGTNKRDVIARLDRILMPYGSIGAYGREDHISNVFLESELAQDRVTALITPVIFLGVAAFLLQLVLSRLVASQRDQIAILKAFGFDNATIASHYLQFAMLTVVIGSVLGLPIGLWLGTGLTRVYRFFFHFPDLPYAPTSQTIAVSLLVSVAAGLVGAFTAVRRAAALAPAVGMRGEPPPVFSRGLFDRLHLTKGITPLARMLLRTLERRPLRTASSILGIALAIMVVILGRFSFDAVDVLLVYQFERAQVDDATIDFTEPRAAGDIEEVRHFPGVRVVEPFRAVAIRMSREHRSRRAGLLGLPPQAQLRRIVDEQGRVIEMPPSGLVISTKLAEVLGITPGESVQIEVLDGQHHVQNVPVTALAAELMGMNAYISRRELNLLAREGDVISGAYITADPALHAQLDAMLKVTPGVRSVSFRRMALQSARDTIQQNMRISNVMLIAFACIIAFGIIFNGSRISLAERSRELASLRVLGFSVAEVTTILTGEQAFVTVAAIPFGMLFGRLGATLIARSLESELYRVPSVVTARSYGIAIAITLAAALISSVTARSRVARLDLVEVLKTKE